MVACGLAAATAVAGSTLSIRLMETSARPADQAAKGYADVADVLRKNLAYQQYTLLASGTLALPAASAGIALGPYTVTCSGTQQNLSIRVKRGRSVLVNTSVILEDDKPFILGGFPSASAGKHMLVFVVR
jgi:hypothetical protein